jgi:replication factor C subunit 2/4
MPRAYSAVRTFSLICLFEFRIIGSQGYAASDIITTVFRVVKNFVAPTMSEWARLEYVKEIGYTHVKILDGLDSFMQLTSLVAKLCRMGIEEKFDQ